MISSIKKKKYFLFFNLSINRKLIKIQKNFGKIQKIIYYKKLIFKKIIYLYILQCSIIYVINLKNENTY